MFIYMYVNPDQTIANSTEWELHVLGSKIKKLVTCLLACDVLACDGSSGSVDKGGRKIITKRKHIRGRHVCRDPSTRLMDG